MDNQKIILYIGSVFLLIIGFYTLYIGQLSQAVTWFILAILFLSISTQMGIPIRAVKMRKIIISICGIILLGIGAITLYFGDLLTGVAWLIAGMLGIFVSLMLVGYKEPKSEGTL
jgi:branched-subunit amino acid ABC-type transport system permease component